MVSTDNLEDVTGIDFYGSLNESVESNISISDWFWGWDNQTSESHYK